MADFNPVIPGTYLANSGASSLLAQPATLTGTPIAGTYRDVPQLPASVGVYGAPLNAGLANAAGRQGINLTPYRPVVYDNLDRSNLPNTEGMGEFRRGLNRGLEQLQALGYGAAGLVGDIGAQTYNSIVAGDRQTETFGTPTGLRDWGYAGYQRNMEEAANYAKTIDRIENIRSLSDAGNWLAGTAGELVPNILGLLTPAGVTAVVGKTIGAGAIKKAGAAAVSRAVAAGATEEAALAAVNRQILQRLTLSATGITSSAIESGGNWGESVEARGITSTNPLIDLTFGIASGLTDVILGAEGSIIRAVTGTPVTAAAEQAFRRSLTGALLRTSAQEAGQEALQEILSIVNQGVQEHNITLTEDDISDILNAAAAGFVGGGLMSPVSISQTRSQNKQAELQNNLQQARIERANNYLYQGGYDTGSIVDPQLKQVIDADAIRQQKANEIQPYQAARQQREEILAQERDRIQGEVEGIIAEWDDTIGRERERLVALDRQIKSLENVESSVGKQASYSPEQRAEAVRRLRMTERPKIVARIARMEQNRDTAIEKRFAEYGKYDARTQTVVAKSAEQQWVLDNQARQQRFANDPQVIEALNTIADEAAVFANRQGDILTDRIAKIRDLIDETKAAFASAIERTNGQIEIPAAAYRYQRRRVADLQRKLRQAIRRRDQIRKVSRNIVRDTVGATDDTISSIGNQIQELYSLADSTFSALDNADLFADGAIYANQERISNLKEVANRLKNAREIVNQRNLHNDPVSLTAEAMIRNAEYNISDEINAQEYVPVARTTESDIMQTQQREYDLNQDAFESDQYLEQLQNIIDTEKEAAAEAQLVQDAQNAAQEIAAFTVPDVLNPEIKAIQDRLAELEQAFTEQQSQELKNSITDVPENIVNQEEYDQVVDQQMMESVQEAEAARPVATEAANIRIENGSQLVEFTRLTNQAKQVTKWLKNSLDRLPVLQENTIIAVDGNDVSLPVELQNKIYDVVQAGQTHPVGAYFNGKVYIFANAVTSKEQAVRALVHEGIGHFGLRCIFTEQQRGQFLSMVYDSFKDTTAWSNFTERYSDQLQSMDKFRQAEEFVAYFAQGEQPSRYLTRPVRTAFQKLTNFIRNVLAKIGFTRITTEDLSNVLTASAHYLAQSDVTGAYLNDASSILLPNGVEGTIPPVVSTGKVWGIYFADITEAAQYNSRLAASISGVPGRSFSNFSPAPENTLYMDRTLFEQPEFIKEMYNTVLDASAFDIVDNPDGTVNAFFLGEDVGQFADAVEAGDYFNSEALLTEFTGQDLYDYISEQTGSQKDAGGFLRQYGILGAEMVHNDTSTYTLFTGDDFAMIPQDPSIPYDEPMFMQVDPSEELTADRRGSITPPDATPVKNDTLITMLRDKFDNETSWASFIRNAKKTGVTRTPAGKFTYSYIERAIEFLADRYRPVQLVQRMLEEVIPVDKTTGEGPITYRTNIYKMLTTLPNRTKARQLELHDTFVNPLIKQVQDITLPIEVLEELGIKGERKGSSKYVEAVYAALGDYMWARHAPERNREVNRRFSSRTWVETEDGRRVRRAKRDPNNPSDLIDASGLSDERAAEIFEYYDAIPGFNEAAILVDTINRERINLLEEYRLITDETAEKLRNTYDYYIPLKNWTEFMDDIAPGYYQVHSKSAGISVGGRTMVEYAKGRAGVPENPVVQSILQMYDTVAVGNRNNISKGLLELVQRAPAKDLWEISNKEEGLYKNVKGRNGEIVLRQKSHANEGSGLKQVLVVDDNAQIQRITIKDDRLANSLRGENVAPSGPIISFISTWTSRIAQLQTSLNPAFIASNPVRDIETAILNMGNVIAENEKRGLLEKGAQIRRGILKDAANKEQFKFLKRIIEGKREDARAINPQLYQEYLDFSANGGHTRMFDLGNFDANYSALVKESKVDPASISTLKKAVELVDNLSNVTENITRFSVYRNVYHAFEQNINERSKAENWDSARIQRELELAKQKSANIALESTVNFTRKGSGASIFNGLFAFSSATIQGSLRIMQNLWRRGDTNANNFKRLSKYIARGAAAGYIQGMLCRALMDDDDDGINKYDKIPAFEKYRSGIIPNPDGSGGYVKIPLAYGYNIFWVLGVVLDDIINGNTNVSSGVADIVKESLGSFSPLDPTDEGLTAFVPTLFRPVAQIAANTTFSGVPIYPENTGRNIPDSQKYWPKTPDLYKGIASFLNTATFGNQFESGFIDVSPESIEHLVTSYFGGVGRVITDTIGLLGIVAGKEVDPGRLPIAGRFYGSVNYSNTSALYNRVAGQIEQAKNAYNTIQADQSMDLARIQSLQNEYQDAYSLNKYYSRTQQQLSVLRKREQELAKQYTFGSINPEYNKQQREIERQKEAVMKQLLRAAHNAGLPIQEGE